MILWFEQLYMDEYVKKHPVRCMKKIESPKLLKRGVTVIALASNSDNLFDIIGSRELFFRHYKKNNIYILALAKNKEEAINLLQQLIKDAFDGTEFIPKKYFSRNRFTVRSKNRM